MRKTWAILAILSNRWPSTIETGSRTRQPARSARCEFVARLTLVDDEHLGPLPLGDRGAVALDVHEELLGGLIAQPDSSKRVDRRAANVARCHASRSSDGDGIDVALVLAPEGGDDLAKENRLARTCIMRAASHVSIAARSRAEKEHAPADPVKKTFLPSATTSLRTICCSGLRTTFCLMSIESLVSILPFIPVAILFPFAPPGALNSWKLAEPDRLDLVGPSSSSSHGRVRFFGRRDAPVKDEAEGLL